MKKVIWSRITWPLAMVLILSVSCASVFAGEPDGASVEDDERTPPVSEDGYYELDSESDLVWFAGQVNGGESDTDGRLTADIEVTEAFVPIGVTNSLKFSGTLDGGGFTVTLDQGFSLYQTDGTTALDFLGLIGYMSDGTVKDLTVCGDVEVDVSVSAIGGIVGYAYTGSVIDGCSSYVNLTSEDQITCVGGIAGYITGDSKISGCMNYGDISECASGNSCVGGIVGTADGTASLGYSVISACGNEGDVSVTGSSASNPPCAGGIAGTTGTTGSLRADYVENCYNSGDISGVWRVGGIAGASFADITDCYNTGTVRQTEEADGGVGGIVGYMDNSSVTNCYSTGLIEQLVSTRYAGAVIGYLNYNSESVSNTYYLSGVGTEGIGYDKLSGTAGVPEEISSRRLKSLSSVLGSVWKTSSSSVNSGYPVLIWQSAGTDEDDMPDGLNITENGTLAYYTDGAVDTSFTGMAKYGELWYYAEKGYVTESYTGLAVCAANGCLYYFTDSELDWSYTGLAKYDGSWYYVADGQLDWNYTGLAKDSGIWYYVTDGVLDWNYTGLAKHGGIWYYVTDGVLDWSYTGLVKHGGIWYYVAGGVLDWNYTGLVKNSGCLYYVADGQLDWNYTGPAVYEWTGVTYYVVNGQPDWTYTGYDESGTLYFVNGVLN